VATTGGKQTFPGLAGMSLIHSDIGGASRRTSPSCQSY
jgi:hypothetical protein